MTTTTDDDACQRDSGSFGGFIVGCNDCESDGSSMVTCCGGAAICAYVLGMGRLLGNEPLHLLIAVDLMQLASGLLLQLPLDCTLFERVVREDRKKEVHGERGVHEYGDGGDTGRPVATTMPENRAKAPS